MLLLGPFSPMACTINFSEKHWDSHVYNSISSSRTISLSSPCSCRLSASVESFVLYPCNTITLLSTLIPKTNDNRYHPNTYPLPRTITEAETIPPSPAAVYYFGFLSKIIKTQTVLSQSVVESHSDTNAHFTQAVQIRFALPQSSHCIFTLHDILSTEHHCILYETSEAHPAHSRLDNICPLQHHLLSKPTHFCRFRAAIAALQVCLRSSQISNAKL